MKLLRRIIELFQKEINPKPAKTHIPRPVRHKPMKFRSSIKIDVCVLCGRVKPDKRHGSPCRRCGTLAVQTVKVKKELSWFIRDTPFKKTFNVPGCGRCEIC